MKTIMVNDKIEVAWDENKAHCKKCNAEIGWGVTKKDKKMPFDFDEKHTSHWATCPNANEFRGAK